MGNLWKRLFGNRVSEVSRNVEVKWATNHQVSVDSEYIVYTDTNTVITKISWEQLSEVTIMGDIFFLSKGLLLKNDGSLNQDHQTIAIPVGTTGQDDFVGAMLNKLNGFDRAAFVNALGSHSQERFVLWRKM